METYIEDGYKVTTYDNGAIVRELIPPLVEPVAVVRARIPALEIRLRFTFAERMAITEGAKTDAGAAVTMADLAAMESAGVEVIPDDPNTQAAFDHLVSAGYITASRKEEILAL